MDFSLGASGGCLCDLSMHTVGGGETRPGLPIDLNLFAEALSSSTSLFCLCFPLWFASF